jgi:hypothetical protein
MTYPSIPTVVLGGGDILPFATRLPSVGSGSKCSATAKTGRRRNLAVEGIRPHLRRPVHKPEQYAGIILKGTADEQILHLRDLAEVELGSEYFDIYSDVDGQPTAQNSDSGESPAELPQDSLVLGGGLFDPDGVLLFEFLTLFQNGRFQVPRLAPARLFVTDIRNRRHTSPSPQEFVLSRRHLDEPFPLVLLIGGILHFGQQPANAFVEHGHALHLVVLQDDQVAQTLLQFNGRALALDVFPKDAGDGALLDEQ